MTLFLFQLVLAVALFVAVNWVGRHSAPFGYRSLSLFERVEEAQAFNFVFRVASPQVFLIVVAAVLAIANQFNLAAGLWRVTALYFVVRIAFNLITGRGIFINWGPLLATGTIATGISYWLTTVVLVSPERALPSPADLTTELWLIVILFLYQVSNRLKLPGNRQLKRQDRYIDARFRAWHTRCGSIVESELPLPDRTALAYSILIYEDFNRPLVYRWIEHFILFPMGLARTLGPMQVTVQHRVSAEEGVRLGARHIAELYPEAERAVREQHAQYIAENAEFENSEWFRTAIARRVAVAYNPDGKYADEVMNLYEVVCGRFFPELARHE